jgi:thymidylate synthase (FAD)
MREFIVKVLSRTESPQQLIYGALHQDYSDTFVYDDKDDWPNESQAGEIAVKRLLSGGRGHYGPLEHPSITFNVGYFPHSVMQQARTHRLASFDVQSFRYTSGHILRAAQQEMDIEDVFYLRPPGRYHDRQGKMYHYTAQRRQLDVEYCLAAAQLYQADIKAGMPEEQARGKLPFDYRQHFVVTFNLRSLLHFFDLRLKRDAQLEIQQMCKLMQPHFESWTPEIAAWYSNNRQGKAKLSP